MSDTRTPIEVTTRYATTVNDLPAAWSFVMDRIDTVGPNPMITINPVWTITVADVIEDTLEGESDGDYPRHFSVVVEGMVEEGDVK